MVPGAEGGATWYFTQFKALGLGIDDLKIGYTITDSDGDKVHGTFDLSNLVDNMPFSLGQGHAAVSEEGLHPPTPTTRACPIRPTARRPGVRSISPTRTAREGQYTVRLGDGHGPGNHAPSVTNSFGAPANLTSNGKQVVWDWDSYDNDKGTLVGKVLMGYDHGQPVYQDVIKISVFGVDGHGNLQYKVDLLGPVDHPLDGQGSLEDALTINIGVTVSDGNQTDDYTRETTLSVRIEDDAPKAGQAEALGRVDEDGLQGGNYGDSYGWPSNNDIPGSDTVASGSLGINWGADNGNGRSVKFDASQPGLERPDVGRPGGAYRGDQRHAVRLHRQPVLARRTSSSRPRSTTRRAATTSSRCTSRWITPATTGKTTSR